MIQCFTNYQAANEWMTVHPEWKPLTMMPGISSGSILVLFEAVKTPTTWADDPRVIELTGPAPKRRGRPPKVKDAV